MFSLSDSLILWRTRLAYRRRRLALARTEGHADKLVTKLEAERIHKWERLVAEAVTRVERREAQLHPAPTNTFTGSPVPGQPPVAATHQTAGLDGFPAVDYFARAGSPCVSPVTGKVTRLSGHDPVNGPVNGVHGPFGWSVYIEGGGKTYYLTHMGSRTVKAGDSVRQGQKIGTVGNYARWGGTDHIHQGVHV